MTHKNLQEILKKLTYDYITAESEIFAGVGYIVKKGEIAILTANNGNLQLSIKNIPDFCKELLEFYEVYRDNNNEVRNQLQAKKEGEPHGKDY